jgi:hypothetical protein
MTIRFLLSQDRETVFTVEYDVAQHDHLDRGPVLVEIRRDINDILGFGLNKCASSGGGTGHVFIESIKQASLADRCGAINVGDLLLSVNGHTVCHMSADEATDLIRGDPNAPHVVQLEILPGLFSSRQPHQATFRTSMPSPSFNTMREQRAQQQMYPGGGGGRSGNWRSQRYQSMTEIDRRSAMQQQKNGVAAAPQSPLGSAFARQCQVKINRVAFYDKRPIYTTPTLGLLGFKAFPWAMMAALGPPRFALHPSGCHHGP